MDLSTLLFLGVIALLVFALIASVRSTYQKTTILKNLTNGLEKYKEHTVSDEVIEIPENGIPTEIVTPLNALIQTFKQDHATSTATNDRLLVSNRIFTHNMETFERLLDAVPDGILMVDLSGNIILANHAITTYLGVEREKIMGKPLKECLDRPNWCDFPLHFDKDLSAEIKIKGTHITQTLKASLKSIVKGQNQIGKILFVKEATAQVIAEEGRRDFISHVSHELKAPLNALKSYSEMLMDGEAKDEETKREFCNTIVEEVDRLAQLVDNLMSTTKIEMGSLQIDRVRVKTREFIKSIFRAGETQAKGKNISTKLILPRGLPAIKIDKTLMHVALLNLFSNAVKYSDADGTVTLKVEEDENTLLFHIIDSGIGIASSDLPKIFDKFYRSSDKNVLKRPGHGLGLALSQQIIKLHGGNLRVTSQPGEGSQFTVILEKTEDILE